MTIHDYVFPIWLNVDPHKSLSSEIKNFQATDNQDCKVGLRYSVEPFSIQLNSILFKLNHPQPSMGYPYVQPSTAILRQSLCYSCGAILSSSSDSQVMETPCRSRVPEDRSI